MYVNSRYSFHSMREGEITIILTVRVFERSISDLAENGNSQTAEERSCCALI